VEGEGKKDPQYQQTREQMRKEETLEGQKTRERGNQQSKGLEIQDNLQYRKGKLWIPAGTVQHVIESEHDTKVAGHMGQDKTIELIR